MLYKQMVQVPQQALRLLLLLAGCAGHVVAASKGSPSGVAVFTALSDWGGSNLSPFTTPDQLTAAKAMDKARLTMYFPVLRVSIVLAAIYRFVGVHQAPS